MPRQVPLSPLVTASNHCSCFALVACCPSLRPYRCLHWGLTAAHVGPLHAAPIVRSAMRSTHDVKGCWMVEHNDDAARYLSLLSNNSIIEQQFNDIAPPAPTTHAQQNVVTSLSSRIERSRIEINGSEINGSDRMKRNHKPSIIIMKQ